MVVFQSFAVKGSKLGWLRGNCGARWQYPYNNLQASVWGLVHTEMATGCLYIFLNNNIFTPPSNRKNLSIIYQSLLAFTDTHVFNCVRFRGFCRYVRRPRRAGARDPSGRAVLRRERRAIQLRARLRPERLLWTELPSQRVLGGHSARVPR